MWRKSRPLVKIIRGSRESQIRVQGTQSAFHLRGAPAGVPSGRVRKTAAQRNTNTAAAPVHSQKPKCQNTECRSTPRIGAAQGGSNRVSSSRHSLQKSPPSGTNVVRAQVQNSPRPRPLHAHQQPDNIPNAINAAEQRARNSCDRRIPRTACTCCGTTRHAQISAIIPATKAPLLTSAVPGEAISKCRCRYPASGSINKAATDIPQAATQ